jgi:zinc transport system permease protein
MFDDFFVRALVGGLGVALVAGPLGCFIVWRRMAYFGDALAHSALLGVALGLAVGIGPTSGVLVIAVAVAVALVMLERLQVVASDTALGILSHSALAVGLVALALMDWVRVDLLSYLFGDILAVSRTDLILIWGAGAAILAGLAFIWRPLLAATVDLDIARAEGLPADAVRLVFMLLIAATVAIAMKIVGVILITALLIIPAAAARPFSATPERMAFIAALAGAVAVIAGLVFSLTFDAPSGPSIVVASGLLFALAVTASRFGTSR